jgi:hypothetical protein
MRPVLACCLLLCLVPGPAAAAALHGHFKSLNLSRQARAEEPAARLSANSVRLDLSGAAPAAGAVWQLSLDQLALYQHPQGAVPVPDFSENRLAGLAWDGSEKRALTWQLQVDRLSLQWQQNAALVTLGRQGIGFGRIGLFSPLDIIAPFAPTALDSEVRPGVDALRAQYFFAVVGEAAATLVFGDGADRSSALVDVTMNAGQVDFLFIGGRLRDRPMAGIGLAGQLGGLGWKGEWAGYRGSRTGSAGGDLYRRFSIAAVELEYRFPLDPILQVQYLYNGTGADRPRDYPLVARSAPLREGLSFLSGKHYLLSGLSRNLTPLVALSGLLIVNLEDDSWLFRPTSALSLADNVSLEIFWSFHQGRGPVRIAGVPVPRSEFGSLGASGGLFLKLYF